MIGAINRALASDFKPVHEKSPINSTLAAWDWHLSRNFCGRSTRLQPKSVEGGKIDRF
jgi:hypothetical protein